MKITCNHPQSNNGTPVILDDYGNPYHYQPGLAAVLTRLGWTQETAALRIGCETTESKQALWTSDSPSLQLLNILREALEVTEQDLEPE